MAADLLYALPGAHVEVKRYQKIAAFRFFEQAEEDAQEGEIPVVLMREDRAGTWWVCHRIEDTGELSERLNKQINGREED